MGLVGSEQDIGRRSGPETGGSPAGIKNWCRRHPVLLTTAVAALTHLLWFFFFANSGGDLAAQDAWAEFVGRHPGTAYNLAWYGGMHPVSYSVVSPYLMSVLGVRTTMMVAGTVSAALTALILVRVRAVRNPLACSLAGAFAYLCNALSGRVTFGLGMMFAVGATAAVFCWPYLRCEHRLHRSSCRCAPAGAGRRPPSPRRSPRSRRRAAPWPGCSWAWSPPRCS